MIHELELDLDPCRFCHQSDAEPSLYEDDKVLAIECRACGARGPLRPVLRPESVEAVARLAAADWNMGSTPNTSERATTEAAPGARRKRPLAKKNGPSLGPHKGRHRKDKPLESLVGSSEAGAPVKRGRPKKELPKGASVEQSSNKAADVPTQDRKPDNGGEAVTSPKRHPIADRIEAYLKATGQTVWSGVFTVNDVTVHGILTGKVKKPREATLATLTKELAKLERQLTGEAVQPTAADPSIPVQQLPHNFREPTGVNRAPAPTAPPRCGRTP